MTEFAERRLDHIEFPYVFLDATYVKAHDGARVVSKAIVVATGVAADGNREVLGLAVGDSEDKAFWTSFLRSLRARGLGGVRLVISDAHEGLRQSIEKVMLGAAWQRCRVHFLRNVLAKVPKGSAEMVAAAVRTIFAQPDAGAVADQLEVIAEKLGRQFPAVEAMLRDAAVDITSFAAFPTAHWRKIWSTNPLDASTRRSNDAPTSWGSSPTKPASYASPERCSSKSTTSGPSPTGATSPKPQWRSSTRSTTMHPTPRRWDREPTNCSPPADEQHQRRRSRRRSHSHHSAGHGRAARVLVYPPCTRAGCALLVVAFALVGVGAVVSRSVRRILRRPGSATCVNAWKRWLTCTFRTSPVDNVRQLPWTSRGLAVVPRDVVQWARAG